MLSCQRAFPSLLCCRGNIPETSCCIFKIGVECYCKFNVSCLFFLYLFYTYRCLSAVLACCAGQLLWPSSLESTKKFFLSRFESKYCFLKIYLLLPLLFIEVMDEISETCYVDKDCLGNFSLQTIAH